MAGTPRSSPVAAAANALGTWLIPVNAQTIMVVNRTGAGEVFLTIDGSTPVVGNANQYFIPAAIASIDISIPQETPEPTLRAISASALSLWVEVLE